MSDGEQGGRHVVITGSSRGLGRALADALASAGHTVAGCAREPGDAGDGWRIDRVDVRDADAMQAWADALFDAYGAPDLVIANAAMINEPAPLVDVPLDAFERLIDVNVNGVMRTLKAFLPRMIEAGSGTLVTLSSGWGRGVDAEVAPYCASKWAIEGLTRALALELPPGLAAIPMNPGVIDTDMLRGVWGEQAGGFGDAVAWARRAAPFVLSLGPVENGRPVTVPG